MTLARTAIVSAALTAYWIVAMESRAQNGALSIECPTNVVLWVCDTNPAAWTYPMPRPTGGACRLPVTVTCTPPPGTPMQLGTNSIRCVATNNCGETADCTFDVIVRRDTNAPLIECPPDLARRACSTTGVVVTFPDPDVFDLGDPMPSVNCTPSSGSVFPIGTTTVHCTAIDRCNNRSECTFTVTVTLDDTPPVVQCPPDIVTNACSPAGTKVFFPTPAASDDFGVITDKFCEPPSGHVFPVGVTTVVCTAVDGCDNRGRCTFTVTVIGDSELPGIDLNRDGMDDVWQIHFNTGALAMDGDSDGDGMSNAAEARAGTDPRDPASVHYIRRLENKEASWLLSWPGVPLKRYQLQGSPALHESAWINLGPPVMGASGIMSATLDMTRSWPALTTNAFFRVVAIDIDADGDGLSAWQEAIIGTSDRDPDTDDVPGGDHTIAEQFLAANPFGPPQLREVTAAHVGGSPQGPAQPILITGAGTAGFYKLASWSVTANTPTHLQETPSIEGHHVKLHTLTPSLSPSLTLNPVVNGRIRDDKNVYFSIYQVTAAGGINSLSTLGYGANASLRVIDYAMAHRSLGSPVEPDNLYQLVTPVIGTNTGGAFELRVLSWTVNPDTGNLAATYDTGNLGHTNLPSDGGSLQIQPLDEDSFVVSYVNKSGILSSWFFEVKNDGVVLARGGGTSGLDLHGKNDVAEAANQFALAPLNAHAFSTALLDAGCRLKLSIWEERVVACDAACYSTPFYITDNTVDLDPAAIGVQLDPPIVTNSRENDFEAHDFFGASLAVGDFNGDGFADVAIGVPGENSDEGAVNIMYGSSSGLNGSSLDQIFTQETGGIGGPEAGDRYGLHVAAGDFNNDGRDDLAISSPYEDSNEGIVSVGVVQVLYGTDDGLDIVGDQVWGQGSDGLPGALQEYDRFGSALAIGDFNGDNYADLAIGVLGEHVGVFHAGAVQIIYGSPVGLTANGNQLLHQESPSILGASEEDDFFGSSLAAGDFDGDGRDDLAIGIPGEEVNGVGVAGAVQVIYGTATGLGSDNNLITQDLFQPGNGDVAGTPQVYGRFGETLAAGDFNNDGRDDLAVGMPGMDLNNQSIEDAGLAHIFYGDANGLGTAGQQTITQAGFIPPGQDITGLPEPYDAFASSLAAADFNGDGFADLAIGAPGESLANNTIQGAGLVHVLRGSVAGLTASSNQTFSAGTNDIVEMPEDGDGFGGALAAGDLNGDGTNDLVIGVPLEELADLDSDPTPEAGAIAVIYSAGAGLDSPGNARWKQGTQRQVRALLTDMKREAELGTDQGTLFFTTPAGEPISNHVASVTKVMTLLLAVEALEDGTSGFALSDDVTVSGLAAGTGGSHMLPKLETNDVMKLELLLHGMMLRSCNKSSVAIAQHLTGETETFGAFTNLMNQKAQQLGMKNTLYTHPAGGCITTPQDMVKLWSNGWLRPLFRQVAGARYYTGSHICGETVDGDPKCYFDLEKFNDSGFPGIDGWKGGNGGLGPNLGVPWCTAALLGQTTRLDRSLAVSLHQTGSTWGDNDRLLEYGYKRLFTPDYRGGNRINSVAVTDFTVRGIDDSLAFTASISTQNRLSVHLWQTIASTSQVSPAGFASVTVTNLPPGKHFVPATLIDMAPLRTVESQRDYWSGHVEAGMLQLHVWRIDREPGY